MAFSRPVVDIVQAILKTDAWQRDEGNARDPAVYGCWFLYDGADTAEARRPLAMLQWWKLPNGHSRAKLDVIGGAGGMLQLFDDQPPIIAGQWPKQSVTWIVNAL